MHLRNGTTIDNYFPNGTYRIHPLVHKHGITNTTSAFEFQSINIKHSNGTIGYANVRYFVNGSLDSFLRITKGAMTTTVFNSTTVRVILSIAHVDAQNGPYWSTHNHLPISWFPNDPFSVSFDNLAFNLLYNCTTGKVQFAVAGMTNGVSIAAFIGHRLMGAVALPNFSGASG